MTDSQSRIVTKGSGCRLESNDTSNSMLFTNIAAIECPCYASEVNVQRALLAQLCTVNVRTCAT